MTLGCTEGNSLLFSCPHFLKSKPSSISLMLTYDGCGERAWPTKGFPSPRAAPVSIAYGLGWTGVVCCLAQSVPEPGLRCSLVLMAVPVPTDVGYTDPVKTFLFFLLGTVMGGWDSLCTLSELPAAKLVHALQRYHFYLFLLISVPFHNFPMSSFIFRYP